MKLLDLAAAQVEPVGEVLAELLFEQLNLLIDVEVFLREGSVPGV